MEIIEQIEKDAAQVVVEVAEIAKLKDGQLLII